jgi:hypothetical protein
MPVANSNQTPIVLFQPMPIHMRNTIDYRGWVASAIEPCPRD